MSTICATAVVRIFRVGRGGKIFGGNFTDEPTDHIVSSIYPK